MSMSHVPTMFTIRRVWLLFASVTAILGARSALAQARFEWPNATVRVESYATAEQCLAATQRVRDSVMQHEVIWRDTIRMTPVEAREPLPAPVIEAARRCALRFAPQVAPLEDYPLLLRLYLQAGRDSDAVTLIARRRKVSAQATEAVQAALLDTLIGAYLNDDAVRPVRLTMAESLVAEYTKMRATSWQQRLDSYRSLMRAALTAGDTVRARRVAEQIMAVVSSIPIVDRRTAGEYGGAVDASYTASNLLHMDELLDSLRRSTSAYIAMQQATWAKAVGDTGATRDFPIGKHAPAIEGDYWFNRADSSTARPTKGRVALVVFLDHPPCELEQQLLCWVTSAALHRLAARFPELEITLVTHTHGYFSEAVAMPPVAEADTLAEWWLEKHSLRGALAVTKTEFWRLPEPDRRRIDRDRPNEVHYSFGRRSEKPTVGSAFLIDRDGRVVHWGELVRDTESTFTQFSEALFARPQAGR
jgi:hypothetical protein